MRQLHLLHLHSPEHKFRESYMQTTLKIFEEQTKKYNYKLNYYVINNNSPDELKPKFKEIEQLVDYSKIGDEEFDRCVQTLNIEQLSNFYRQKAALEKIKELAKSNEDLYMILEDDAIILPEFQPNLEKFLKDPMLQDWDILFMCASLPDKNTNDFKLIPTKSLFSILPSKEAYCINPAIIDKLLTYLNKIYYTYRIQLSRWLKINPEIRSMCPSMRLSLEGSKIGFMPSTTTENNILLYNYEFMEMFKLMTGQGGAIDLQKVKQFYKSVEHLKSPEIMHIYAVILFKMDKKEQAKEMFIDAINQMMFQNGCLTARSELLNNTINIHGIVQEDLEMHRKNPSKYERVIF
jgi:GR25 family glycosyltransferase involved in LPS biosynthesis